VNHGLSVIIPVRDDATRLTRAIRSVLDGAEDLHEIVVVDDGSRDGSAEAARSFGAPVIVHQRPPLGEAAARNFGVETAACDLIAFNDSDDVWAVPRPDPRRAALAGAPDAIVLGRTVVEDEDGRGRSEPFLLYQFSAALIPRAAFERAGPVPEGFRIGCDTAWFLAARDAGVRLLTVPDVVFRYRMRPGSMYTSGPPGEGLLNALNHAIRRRRESTA
jgi:glycosyltransferase involved in cell wall biosynthesis